MPSSFWFIFYQTGLFCDSSFPDLSCLWPVFYSDSSCLWPAFYSDSSCLWPVFFRFIFSLIYPFTDWSFPVHLLSGQSLLSDSSYSDSSYSDSSYSDSFVSFFCLYIPICYLSGFPYCITRFLHIRSTFFFPPRTFHRFLVFTSYYSVSVSGVSVLYLISLYTFLSYSVQVIAKPYNPRKYRIFRRLILIRALSLSGVHTKAVFRLRYSISKIISGSSGNCLIYLLYTKCLK